jgi:erythromycin esterase
MRELTAWFLVLAFAGCGGTRGPSPDLNLRVSPSGGASHGEVAVAAVETGSRPISGRVLDGSGRPVSGAVVAATSTSDDALAGIIETSADGGFALEVPRGMYALTATSPGRAAARLAPVQTPTTVILRLGAEGDALSGRLVARDGAPLADARVRLTSWEENAPSLFYVGVDQDGRFEVVLPRGLEVEAEVADDAYVSEAVRLSTLMADEPPVLVAYPRREVEAEPSADALDWLHKRVVGLEGPGLPRELARVFPGARVIGLGEATHGTREFANLNRRIIEELMRAGRLRAIGIEAAWAESLAINDYVLHGRGDVREALTRMHFWTVRTAEMVEVVESVRRWNRGRPLAQRVRMVGIDMQFSAAAVAALGTYLTRTSDPQAGRVVRSLEALSTDPTEPLSPDQARKVRLVLDRLLLRFDARRADYLRRSTVEEWTIARHHVEVLSQFAHALQLAGRPMALEVRDAAMARNSLWLEQTYGGPVVVWAHNAHVARLGYGVPSMGEVLSSDLGARYVSVGYLFEKGTVRAKDGKPAAESKGVIEQAVEAPPAHYWGSAFARLPGDVFGFDLRPWPTATSRPAWLTVPHHSVEVGTVLDEREIMRPLRRLEDYFDLAIFVRDSTATTVLPKATPAAAMPAEDSAIPASP